MGILDDAIRQHLELKRQHGAASSELEQLESEAFGPVARPGDPEFETGEEPAPAGEQPALAEADDHGTGEDPTTVIPQASAEAAVEPESVEQPIPEAPEEAIFDVDDVDLGDIDLSDDPATPAERARIDNPHLEDTVDHPAPEVASLSEELEAAAPTPAAPDSEELEAPAETPDQDEPGSLEFEELPGETVEPRGSDEDDEADDDSDDDSDDDLLEETPDFLKDAPDGEDLWFEQGKPKDFDF